MSGEQLAAIHKTLPATAVFACTTAAWMHGCPVVRRDVVEVVLPASATIRTSGKVVITRSDLEPTEICRLNSLPVTSLHRTLRDLCLFSTPINALIACDFTLFKKLTNKAKLLNDPAAARGRRGSARFRRLVELAAPAESPMETRLRDLLLTGGLPPPEVQAELRDQRNRLIGRVDLLYRDAKLVIEYDGANHRDRLVSDDQRQNLIMDAGYRILRFTAQMCTTGRKPSSLRFAGIWPPR